MVHHYTHTEMNVKGAPLGDESPLSPQAALRNFQDSPFWDNAIKNCQYFFKFDLNLQNQYCSMKVLDKLQ